MPFVPGAVGIAVLEPPDQRERRTLEAPAGTELQRRMVVEQLGALADLAQRSTFTDDRAAAEAADRERRCRRAELDRSAAVRTGGAVGALGRRVGGQRSGSASEAGSELASDPAEPQPRPVHRWARLLRPRPASSATRPSSRRTLPA